MSSEPFQTVAPAISLNTLQKRVLNYRAPKHVQSEAYRDDTAKPQPIENGIGKVNVDEYRFRIEKLPDTATISDPQSFIRYVRKNFGDFLNSDDAEISPHSSTSRRKWNGDDPTGAVMVFDLNRLAEKFQGWAENLADSIADTVANTASQVAVNKGSVLCSNVTPLSWTFSPVWTSENGLHPVSGNRRWVYEERTDEPDVFRFVGIDRITDPALWGSQIVDDSIDQGGAVPLIGNWNRAIDGLIPEVFEAGEKTWSNFVDNLTYFIGENGGSTTTIQKNAWRAEWESISRRYFSPTGRWYNPDAPIPVLSAPSEVPAGTEVTFSAAESSNVGGGIITHKWEVEMGTDTLATGTGEKLNVTFPRAGNYYLNLTVSDLYNRSNTLNTTITVQES